MHRLDDLLRTFRANVPDPLPGAEERIAARVHGAGTTRRRGRERRRILRIAAAPAAVAAAIMAMVAFSPGDVRDVAGGPAPLLARAEAAVASRHEILALAIHLERTSEDPTIAAQSIEMRQWSLSGTGRAMQWRVLISERPFAEPPTDEDSSMVIDRRGGIVDERYWTPVGDMTRGELTIGGPDRTAPYSPTLAGVLREAYRRGKLRAAGSGPDGTIRLRGEGLQGSGSCPRSTVLLDPDSFVPRRIVTVSGGERCGSGKEPMAREVWTVRAEALPVTAENLRLLQIGDWPVARVLRWTGPETPPEPIEGIPPVPPLERG